MSGVEVTRDQLLATIYELQPGDLLVLKLRDDATPRDAQRIADVVEKSLRGSAIRFLILAHDIEIEAWHQKVEWGGS